MLMISGDDIKGRSKWDIVKTVLYYFLIICRLYMVYDISLI